MKRITVLFSVCIILFGAGPLAGEEKAVLVDECSYASAEAARAQWKPIKKGFPAVEVAEHGGRAVLKLPCNFTANEDWRLTWERSGKWDLSACRKIALDVAVDPGRAMFMRLSLQSGPGWYRRWFIARPGTNTVTLLREEFETGSKPAGWDKITAIRLRVMYDGVDRTVLLSNLRGLAGEDPAAETSAEARQARLRTYAAGVPSQPGEFRAVWCHSPKGCHGMTWDQAMKTLADAGFNAAIVNVCWGDAAAYKSKVLPVVSSARERDLLAECVAAGKKHGIAVHAWKCNLRCGRKNRLYKDLQRDGRLMQEFNGETVKYAMCPSDPANIKLEVDSMVEMARDYDVAGIHFDYIRYPGDETCYCPRCRKQFETEYKVKVKNWPADVRTGELKKKYLQFRRDRITAIVAAVHRQAHKVKPDILVSAAVYWHWPSTRNYNGQDWKLWVEKGYLDIICPMMYVPGTPDFEDQTRAVSGWVDGRIPLMPGIGAVLGRMTPDETLRRVQITRKFKTAGFVLFQYRPPLPEKHLPLLKLGATAEKTTWTPPKRKTGK